MDESRLQILITGMIQSIVGNNKFNPRPDPIRHFRALKLFFMHFRSDARIIRTGMIIKPIVHQFCLDWVYASTIPIYKQLAIAFATFLVFY